MLSVKEAAQRLAISERRVRQQLAAGSLAGVKVGRDWQVDLPSSGLRRGPGRPLSARSAWQIVAARSASRAPARARSRLNDVLTGDPEEIGARLSRRAERLLMEVAPADMADLRRDPRIAKSGLSSSLSRMDSPAILEGYVRQSDAQRLRSEYMLRPARRRDAPVVLHVVPDDQAPADLHRLASDPLVVAADLVEHGSARSREVAAQILESIR